MQRELIRYAVRRAAETGTSPTAVLEALHTALAGGAFEGTILTGTTTGGQSVSFALAHELSPQAALRLVGGALDWVAAQADPNAPELPPRYTRARVSFAKADLR